MLFHPRRQFLKSKKKKPSSLKANINTWLNNLNFSLLCDSLWDFFFFFSDGVFVSSHCANSTRQLPLSVTFSLSSGRVPEVCSMTSSLASVSIFSLWAWPLLWVNQQSLNKSHFSISPVEHTRCFTEWHHCWLAPYWCPSDETCGWQRVCLIDRHGESPSDSHHGPGRSSGAPKGQR